MSKTYRQVYDTKIQAADALPPATKRIVVEDIVNKIRRDKNVKPLVLCAFLQDHASIIRECFSAKEPS